MGARVQYPPEDLVWDTPTGTSPDYSFPEPNHWIWLQCVGCHQGALRLGMLPGARACPQCGLAWIQSFFQGAMLYPPYGDTPWEAHSQDDEGQGSHEEDHSTEEPEGDHGDQASAEHYLDLFYAIFPEFNQVFEGTRRTPTSRRPRAEEKDVLGDLL